MTSSSLLEGSLGARVSSAAGLRTSAAAALALGIAGFLLGYLSLGHDTPIGSDPITGPRAAIAGSRGFGAVLLDILGHNVPACLLLMSGVVTAGLSTAIGMLLVSTFIGATMAAAVGQVGGSAVAGSILGYAPVEFLALALAATAGLLPIVTVVRHRNRGGIGGLQIYREALPRSLRIFALAVALVLIAAGLEAAVIIGRS